MLLKSMRSFCSFFLLLSCQSFEIKKTNQHQLMLKPFWVSDTLSAKNNFFRKQNKFTPIVYQSTRDSVIHNSIITANSFDGLTSFKMGEKTILWRFKIPQGVEAAGLSAGDSLFVGGLDGVFYSIDLDNGQLNWKFDTQNEIVSEPILNNGVVYFLNGANALFALDAATGKQNWVYNRQETSTAMTIRGGSRPVIDGKLIYLGFSDGSLVALNIATGTPQWEVLLNKNSRFKDIDASPLIDGDKLFINSYDDKLYCLSKSNGSLIWKSDFGGATAPVVVGDRLISSTSRGSLVSLSKNDGKLLWTVSNIAGISTEPLIHKGYVVVGESQGRLQFFDILTGQFVAGFDPGLGIASRPVMDQNENIYFISGEAVLYGLKIQKISDSAIPFIQ